MNVKINFAPNIETIKIKPGFFPDNVCTYLTIYSLENIIDIYVKTLTEISTLMKDEDIENMDEIIASRVKYTMPDTVHILGQ